MDEKICVTGLGLIGPFGFGNEAFFQSVTGGESFLEPVKETNLNRLGGLVPDFSIKKYVKRKNASRYSMITQYTLASAQMAVSDADLDVKKIDSEKFAVFFGTAGGGLNITEKICNTIIEKGYKYVNPLLFQQSVFNAPASLLSIIWDVKGPCLTMPMGLSAGGCALSMAVNYFRNHDIDYALVLATDEFARVSHVAHDHLKLLSPNDENEEGARPFDAKRNGFVVAEGSAAIFLEKESLAREREGRIHGEIAGCGMAGDGYKAADNHPDGRGVSLAMTKAMNQAGIGPGEVDYIAAFSHGDKVFDRMEINGIKKAMGEHAPDIPISSIKSSIGETFAPGGLFNVAAGLFAIRDGIIPPTINYKNPDPACDLDVVPNQARKKRVDAAIANAFSWGGLYNSIIVRRYGREI